MLNPSVNRPGTKKGAPAPRDGAGASICDQQLKRADSPPLLQWLRGDPGYGVQPVPGRLHLGGFLDLLRSLVGVAVQGPAPSPLCRGL